MSDEESRGQGHDKGQDCQSENKSQVLSEDEALAQARALPNEALSMYITFSPDDRDNPRNWPKWRRWYISIMASWLNVVTYVVMVFVFSWSMIPILPWSTNDR